MRMMVVSVDKSVETIENLPDDKGELEAVFFESCGVVATVHKDSGEMVSVIVQVSDCEIGTAPDIRTLPIA